MSYKQFAIAHNFKMLSKVPYDKIKKEIPFFTDKNKLEELDKYFNTTKKLSKDEHSKWRLYKKCMLAILKAEEYRDSSGEITLENITTDEETAGWIGMDTLCNCGFPETLKTEIIVAR